MAKCINTNMIVDSRLLSHKCTGLKYIIIEAYSQPAKHIEWSALRKMEVNYNLIASFTLTKSKLHQEHFLRIFAIFKVVFPWSIIELLPLNNIKSVNNFLEYHAAWIFFCKDLEQEKCVSMTEKFEEVTNYRIGSDGW